MNRAGSLLLAILLLAGAYSLLHLLTTERPIGSERLVGRALPHFAAPLATGTFDNDANVTQRDGQGGTPACDVRLTGVFNVCDVGSRPLAIIFWSDEGVVCERQVDRLDMATRDLPALRTVAIAMRMSRADAARIARAHHWRLPAAIDRDGALTALYKVGGCPTTFFARGGVIQRVRLGVMSDDRLVGELRELSDG